MEAEITALEENHTWTLVHLPPNITPIGSKWVYKIKRHADGTIERYKARLVAKGYTQTEGLDYFDTFSPVAKMTTIRTLLALASIKGWHLHQLDVNNAFLHGDLQEDVYMQVPADVHTTHPNQVCKLLKSLYGLKQASRQWFGKLSTLLLHCGYNQSPSDHSLFLKSSGNNFTALLVYVDDIVLAGNSLEEFTYIKKELDTHFRIKDLGVLKYFLGLEVAHSRLGVSICQRKYCLDLLSESGLLGCKPAKTPLDATVRLRQDNSPLLPDVGCYRRLVGRLIYLTTTRPDISYAVQQLSQFMAAPTTTHFRAAQRVLRYLKNSPGRGLFYQRTSSCRSKGSVMPIGGVPGYPTFRFRLLFLFRKLTHNVEVEQASNGFSLIRGSRVPSFNISHLRAPVALLSTSRS